jgi:hypothetical protein
MSAVLTRSGASEGDPVDLRVINLPLSLVSRFGSNAKAAIVSPLQGDVGALLETSIGGLVLSVVRSDAVEPHSVALSELAQLNTRLPVNVVESFRRFNASDVPLSSVLCDVRLRFVTPHAPEPRIDAMALSAALGNAFFGHVLTVAELLLFTHGHELVLRVLSVQLEQSGADDADELHVFRGCVTASTRFFLVPTEEHSGIVLERAEPFPVRPPQASVAVQSSDGEEFLISRRVLRPCLALTRAVRDPDVASVAVDVDACTLDRALLFMQLFARGKHELFEAPLTAIEDLHRAAKTLEFQLLAEHCAVLLGTAKQRIRPWLWREVEAAVSEKRLLLVIDGGVFDVTGWLDKHPGGAKIIPAQAMLCDATVFFEVYHASRESFEYLRQFYVGEICSLDELAKVPQPTQHRKRSEASQEFIDAFRSATSSFRVGQSSAWKSF